MSNTLLGRASSKSSIQSKVMCTSCRKTDIDCSESLCSSNQLTAQCTDQCVVIACSDPNHEESICEGDGPHSHCDFVCDEAIECTDCYGFDAFLRCCDEYRPYCPEPSRPILQAALPQNMVWDSSFETLWCPCDQQLDELNEGISPERPLNSRPNTFSEARSTTPSPKLLHSSQQGSLQTSPSSRSPSLPRESAICKWDSCQGSFHSQSELVGHIGAHFSSGSSDFFLHSTNQTLSQDPVACLWAECDNTYNASIDDFKLFVDHIFHEHLGVTSPNGPLLSSSRSIPSPPSPPYQSYPTNSPNAAPAESSRGTDQAGPPSPTPSGVTYHQHLCTDIHECRWKDCGQIFNSCDGLTAHITNIHVGGGKSHYDCHWEQCTRNGSQGFQSKQKICRHVQSHTGHRPFQCMICHQNFSEAATLQQHIRRHTQEKPYVCDHPGCGKTFAITGALTIHKRTHNGDKPFKCSFCDRGFAESSNLSKHLRTHTGARPYTCREPGCDKSFARPDQLNRHKGVHRKQLRGINQAPLKSPITQDPQ